MAPTITTEPEIPLSERILSFLPEQGSFEVQHDQAGKTHNWHRHSVTETLFVVEGGMELFWHEDGQVHRGTVTANSKIVLPANTLHGSTAAEGGCVYLIAPEAGVTAETTFLSAEEYPVG